MNWSFHPQDPNDQDPGAIVSLLCSARRKLLEFDHLQILTMTALLGTGMLFIYTTGQQIGGGSALVWKRQALWILIGLALWLTLSQLDYRYLGALAPAFYILALFLLLLVFMFGVKMYGAKRWLRLFGVTVQPTEFAKIAAMLAGARLASLKNFNINRIDHFIALGALIFIPFMMVLTQPDLGSSLVFPTIFATLAFTANLKWRWILLLLVLIAVLAPLSFPFLKDYQKERIMVFLDPDRDPRRQGWTSRQALLAVGSGGLYGKGIMRGTQNSLGYLPQTVSNTDLIFSVIAEETGFAGSLMLLGVYAALLFSVLRVAFFAGDAFGCYLGACVAMLFFEHSFVNIGMSVRLAPVTGLPLPLVSYGGSFLVSSMICLGMVQSVHIHRGKKQD